MESRTDHELTATIGVRRGALDSQFTTRNELDANRRISMRLVSGPFKTLEGEWTFTAVDVPGSPGAGWICCCASPSRTVLTGMLFERLFEETVASMVDAFVARARALANDPVPPQ